MSDINKRISAIGCVPVIKQLICSKLLDLMETQHYESIKVTDLVKYIGISVNDMVVLMEKLITDIFDRLTTK